MTLPSPLPSQAYNDDELVYVDPESKKVVGKVEWTKSDRPKSMPFQVTTQPEQADASAKKPGKPEKKERTQFWRKYFPWGTYRSMRRVYKLQGKVKDPEPHRTLDEVLPRALSEAFWTWGETPKPSPETSEQQGENSQS